MQSAAYDNGVLYFASMDMYGYALNASNGGLVWRSPQKLPGEQYAAWWPVVHGNYVVWSGSSAYKRIRAPGIVMPGPRGLGSTPSLVCQLARPRPEPSCPRAMARTGGQPAPP